MYTCVLLLLPGWSVGACTFSPLNYIFHQSRDCCANSMSNSVDDVDERRDEWKIKITRSVLHFLLSISMKVLRITYVYVIFLRPQSLTVAEQIHLNFVSSISSSVSHTQQSNGSQHDIQIPFTLLSHLFSYIFFSSLAYHSFSVRVYLVLLLPIPLARPNVVSFVLSLLTDRIFD